MDNEQKEKLINTEEFGVVDKVHSEERMKGISSSQIRRYCWVFTTILILVWLLIVTVLYFKLKHDVTLRTKVVLKNGQMTTDMKELSSLERVKEAVNSLIPALENLRLNLTSLTNSSDSKMRRFGRVVEKLKDRIDLTQNDLSHLNVSLHTELAKPIDPAIPSSIENIRKELSAFRNFTASKIGQIITDMNNTNMFEMFSRQNTSHHSNVRYTSAALASKLKDADEKFVNLRNFTATELRQFRNDLNNTQESLGRARNEFVYFNKSIHSLLQAVAKSQSMLKSMCESNKKLGATERKTMDEKLSKTNTAFSKTNAAFRESLNKEKEATSALEKKITSNQEGQHSQQNQIAELWIELNKLKNKASGHLRVDVPLILTSALILSSIFILN